MKFTNSFAAIITVALTAGVNISAMAAPVNSKTIKEANVQTPQVETVKKSEDNTNTKSQKNTKPSQDQNSSQGNKCVFYGRC